MPSGLASTRRLRTSRVRKTAEISGVPFGDKAAVDLPLLASTGAHTRTASAGGNHAEPHCRQVITSTRRLRTSRVRKTAEISGGTFWQRGCGGFVPPASASAFRSCTYRAEKTQRARLRGCFCWWRWCPASGWVGVESPASSPPAGGGLAGDSSLRA